MNPFAYEGGPGWTLVIGIYRLGFRFLYIGQPGPCGLVKGVAGPSETDNELLTSYRQGSRWL